MRVELGDGVCMRSRAPILLTGCGGRALGVRCGRQTPALRTLWLLREPAEEPAAGLTPILGLAGGSILHERAAHAEERAPPPAPLMLFNLR
eukprot:scaffold7384_cov396-Prasinococcus_capsulatus_cf.AAC.1